MNSTMSEAWTQQSVEQMIVELDEKRRQCGRVGPGNSVAVVVIDMQYFFLPDGNAAASAALAANRRLLDHARAQSIPVFLVRNVFDRKEEVNPFWRAKMERRGAGPSIMRDDPHSELHEGLGRIDTDFVVEKKHASGFAGSTLHDLLSVRGIDTILLTGTSTSGCVRATAVDGAARHYRMQVVEECTFEPRPLSATVALWEMADRYADVITFGDAAGLLDRLAAPAPIKASPVAIG